ncbi:MAG: hypothetical protein LAP21_06815 [Acidobacteriia bacterium]|nr:hypothetical protein [Terriglobia bacterium]
MKSSLRFAMLPILLLGLAHLCSGQNQAPVRGPKAVLGNASPGFARVAPIAVNSVQPAQASSTNITLDFPANAVSSHAVFATRSGNAPSGAAAAGTSRINRSTATNGGHAFDGQHPNLPTIDGLDSLATFGGGFINQAGPDLGTFFPFTMIGNHPLAGGTTVIPAQITTVNLRLLNADGSLNVAVPFEFRDRLEDSPNFAQTNYRSGRHIQYADAVHRAQFFHAMGDDWHTVLHPQFVNDVTINVPQFVNIQFADGTVLTGVQSYFLARTSEGKPVVFMLDLLFNFFYTNQVIDDINAGNFTTDGLSMTMFPNTFLFSIDEQANVVSCCVLGFHTYFNDPIAIPQPRWVTLFASWISPGTFGPGFEDVAGLSHEVAESFADPFVDNTTSSWQFPGVDPKAQICQSNLEEGDPLETLATETVSLPLREGHEVFTYHPQIIPLLQWFEMGAKSNAVDGAFSFPDETALPHSALPCPL